MKRIALSVAALAATLVMSHPAKAWTDRPEAPQDFFTAPSFGEVAEPETTGSVGRHRARRYQTLKQGNASWYGPGFQGRRTANGERFNTHAFTAAHRRLPFGTRVRVTNTANGRSVVVRINDRGPFHGNRVIDLSQASARAIGMSGVANVRLSLL